MTPETSRSRDVTIWRRRSTSCAGPVRVSLTRCIARLPPERSLERSSKIPAHNRTLFAWYQVLFRCALPGVLRTAQLVHVAARDRGVRSRLILGAVGWSHTRAGA